MYRESRYQSYDTIPFVKPSLPPSSFQTCKCFLCGIKIRKVLIKTKTRITAIQLLNKFHLKLVLNSVMHFLANCNKRNGHSVKVSTQGRIGKLCYNYVAELYCISSVELYSLELYKRMVAFVMSYSFTEFADTSPEMIPMADMLNHHTNNNACLIYERNSLKMISTRKIEEVYLIFFLFHKAFQFSAKWQLRHKFE